MTEHVGYEKHEATGKKSGNSRNGKSAKTLKGSFGTMPIEVPAARKFRYATLRADHLRDGQFHRHLAQRFDSALLPDQLAYVADLRPADHDKISVVLNNLAAQKLAHSLAHKHVPNRQLKQSVQ